MKTMRILPAVLLIGVAVLMVSCGSSREYHGRPYPPRSQTNFSLIIAPSPGLLISRHSNGMYYHRDPYGRIYWQGSGNRYYIDRQYVPRSYHRHQQYNDWRRSYNNNGRRRR